jgi:hypothetical protein
VLMLMVCTAPSSVSTSTKFSFMGQKVQPVSSLVV